MTKYIKADEFYYPYHVKGAGYLAIEGDSFGDWQAEAPHPPAAISICPFLPKIRQTILPQSI